MRKIKDEELREYQEQIGQVQYKKISTYACNLSNRIRANNLRASRKRYENSEEKLKAIKEKYKNGVTKNTLKRFVSEIF